MNWPDKDQSVWEKGEKQSTKEKIESDGAPYENVLVGANEMWMDLLIWTAVM